MRTASMRRMMASPLTRPIPRAEDRDVARLVNGVFKGGGAKGIVYAGALKAATERDVVFTAVAGSSAGAITAALVAADLDPSRLEEEATRGLAAVHGNGWLGFAPFRRKT